MREKSKDFRAFSQYFCKSVVFGAVLCYNSLLEEIHTLILPPEHRIHQRAVGVAILAAEKIAAGEPCDGNALTPNYLRLSQAEREKLEKANKR